MTEPSKAPVRPPRLKSKARIGLVAPSGPLLERDDLRRSEELCRALGWEPILGAHAGEAYGYLAGNDTQRVTDLNAALAEPSLDAVWCLRGCYGLTRILDRIDYDALAARPKVVLGFSDVTALLLALHARTGVVTMHGPVARLGLTAFSRTHLERVVGDGGAAPILDPVAPTTGVTVPRAGRVVPVREGVAEGRLVGGDFTLLQHLIGTPWLPSLDGAILFLEDVG